MLESERDFPCAFLNELMIPARGPQTKLLYNRCCAIFGVPYTFAHLVRRLASWGGGDMVRASHGDEWLARATCPKDLGSATPHLS